MITQNIFALTEIAVQIESQIKPNKYSAPLLVRGLNIVIDENSKVVFEAAELERPMASSDFTEEILQAINLQMLKLGLVVKRISEDGITKIGKEVI